MFSIYRNQNNELKRKEERNKFSKKKPRKTKHWKIIELKQNIITGFLKQLIKKNIRKAKSNLVYGSKLKNFNSL